MKYYEDDNFITKVGNGEVVEIAKATGERRVTKIGDYTFYGLIFDQEWYDRELAKCDKEM